MEMIAKGLLQTLKLRGQVDRIQYLSLLTLPQIIHPFLSQWLAHVFSQYTPNKKICVSTLSSFFFPLFMWATCEIALALP